MSSRMGLSTFLFRRHVQKSLYLALRSERKLFLPVLTFSSEQCLQRSVHGAPLGNCLQRSVHCAPLGNCLQRSVHSSPHADEVKKNFDKEVEDEELYKELKSCSTKLLSESITPELEKDILEDVANRSFVLRQALAEIKGLENMHGRKKHLMTLPKSLTTDEWRTLISLMDYRSRLRYLQSVQLQTVDSTMEEILEGDKVYCNPLHISEELIASAVGDDQESRKRIKIFQMYHEMSRQEGEMVPYVINELDLVDISNLKSVSGHRKYLMYLFKNEMMKFHSSLRKIESKLLHSVWKQENQEKIEKEEHLVYGLGHNTFFFRFQKHTMNHFYNGNTIKEFQSWGVPLIIDMSHYTEIETDSARRKSLFRELTNAVQNNRMVKTPFQLHLTGFSDKNLEFLKKQNYFETEEVSCNITQQSHLEMFPKEQMVYLSPDSNFDLKQFNPNDIYVIGGIVDKTDARQPLTLSAAKRLKIRHARFPMRRNLGLSADLNIDTCVNILNDLKESQDWFYSFRWVPGRFFSNRIRSNTSNEEHELIYRAHRNLSPTSWKGEDEMIRNQRLGPAQYRSYYKRIMESRSKEEMMEILDELKV